MIDQSSSDSDSAEVAYLKQKKKGDVPRSAVK